MTTLGGDKGGAKIQTLKARFRVNAGKKTHTFNASSTFTNKIVNLNQSLWKCCSVTPKSHLKLNFGL